MNLRDALLAALTDLPGSREFHLHVLLSAPRKYSALYPFARPRPRSYLQDILVLLSEQSTPDAPRKFVSAIEASVYNVPTTDSAILYVSKVDSTGQGMSPSPTSALVSALLKYYADPTTRPISAKHIWIQLFARAQNQYLFPNSSEYPGKRPLGDIKLCAWWKRVFSDVAMKIDTNKAMSRLYYILAGLSEFEASHALQFAAPPAENTKLSWTYGHPYSQSDIPLPCPKPSGPDRNIGHFIPTFDDDPKARFMDEIAYTTEAEGVRSPERKRQRLLEGESEHDESSKPPSSKERGDRLKGDLGAVSPDEFWERMSFRQECIAGAVTGFFTMGISMLPADDDAPRSAVSPLAPQPGQVSSNLTKRILSSLMNNHEFATAELCIRATGVLEKAIEGLCDGLEPILEPPRSKPKSKRRDVTPERETTLAPPPPRTPPPRLVNGKRELPDVSPNPFPEPVASLETYRSYIYGSVCVSNPPLGPKPGTAADGNAGAEKPKVTVLAARKKKRKPEA
ncbi:hypothetical protein PLICRDRAFT_272675 [Plicaturopsis crispa FD-325 SS-3]|nr:hypothetical protein PLICRDRAFT_272675 [Plicaturopsis crispa FD-325 SS-3]